MTALAATALTPTKPWQGRHLLDFTDYQGRDILALLTLAKELKSARARGESTPLLAGQTLAMIFEKASTRTRVSFEVGMYELGGHALYLDSTATQLGRGEPISDTARVLSRYVQGIMMRTHGHSIVSELAHWSTVPVINGLTDEHHPCQALADLLTIWEHFGQLKGVTLAYIGDGNNIAHSLLQACALTGIHIRVAVPRGFEPLPAIVAQSRTWAAQHHSELLITDDPQLAATGADILYTDVWASMGQEAQADERKGSFSAYQVDEALFALADPQAVFMHDLPAHRGEEVTASVIDGPRSIIFDQAENRLHAQKALLAALLGGVTSL